MSLVTSFSGIRGIYNKDFTESAAVRYAHSYVSFLRNTTKKKNVNVVIGMDTRPSSVKLADAIMGILDCSFIDVGIAPTPAIELAVRRFNADGGIIITASHNEPYWNGLKFLGSDGSIIDGNSMGIIINNARHLRDFHKIGDRKILEKNPEAIKSYTDFIFGIVGRNNLAMIKDSGQKVVLDPNGGTGAIARKILEQAGVKAFGVNMQYGEFNRAVEPTEESLVYLKNVIDENKADFAAGFDCDADRIEILMQNGRFLPGNCILALVVDEVLSSSKNPRSQTVVVNDATSNVVRDVVQKYGAKIKETEVGETNVVEEMKRQKSIVGGEGSSGGAIISPSRCRDGILTLLIVLSIIAKKDKKLQELADELPKYFTLRKKMEFNAKNHDKIKKHLKDHYSGRGFEIRENGGLKGSLKVITGKNSFVWFRASKTEAGIFRMISDSDRKEEAERLIEEAERMFNEANK